MAGSDAQQPENAPIPAGFTPAGHSSAIEASQNPGTSSSAQANNTEARGCNEQTDEPLGSNTASAILSSALGRSGNSQGGQGGGREGANDDLDHKAKGLNNNSKISKPVHLSSLGRSGNSQGGQGEGSEGADDDLNHEGKGPDHIAEYCPADDPHTSTGNCQTAPLQRQQIVVRLPDSWGSPSPLPMVNDQDLDSRAISLTDPGFSPGRTTKDADMAAWAFEHGLSGATKPPKKQCVATYQSPSGMNYACTAQVRGGSVPGISDSPEMPLLFTISMDSLQPLIALELRLWPKPVRATAEHDRYIKPSERVRAEFPVYCERDFDPCAPSDRKPLPFAGAAGVSTAPKGPVTFSRYLRGLTWCEELPQLPGGPSCKRAPHWHLDAAGLCVVSFSFNSVVEYNRLRGAAALPLTAAQKSRVAAFWALIDHCAACNTTLDILVNWKASRFGVAWRRLLSLPNPPPQPYWPWVRRLDESKLRRIKGREPLTALQTGSFIKDMELDTHWIDRARVEYPGNNINLFRTMTVDQLRFNSAPPQRLAFASVVQFSGAAQYLAHVVCGFLYTHLAQLKQQGSLDGMRKCRLLVDMQRGSSVVIILVRARPIYDAAVGAPDAGATPEQEAVRPVAGMPVEILFPGHSAWYGTVVAMPPLMGREYEVAVRCVRPADPLARPTAHTETQARFIFGWHATSMRRYHSAINRFFLDAPHASLVHRRGRLYSILMGRVENMCNAWYNLDLPPQFMPVLEKHAAGANPEQRNLLGQVFENPLTLLQGPPGTGKTSTINRVLCMAADLAIPFAVYAESNAAVDVIVGKFVETHGAQAEGFYRIRPTVLDEMASQLVATGSEETVDLGLTEENDMWSTFGVLRATDDRALSLGAMLLRRLQMAERGEISAANEIFDKELLTLRRILETRKRLYEAEGNSYSPPLLMPAGGDAQQHDDDTGAAPGGSDTPGLPDNEPCAVAGGSDTPGLPDSKPDNDEDEDEDEDDADADDGNDATDGADGADGAINTLANRIRRATAKCFKGYVRQARGIFTTLGKSRGNLARVASPRMVVIDEGSQAMEGSTVFPLIHHVNTWDNVLLVGDHLQLPPCVITTAAENPFQTQCGLSLFERLVEAGHPHVVSLHRQYRMDPTISTVVNCIIYSGRLQDGGITLDPQRPGRREFRAWVTAMRARVQPGQGGGGAAAAYGSSSVFVQVAKTTGYHWGSTVRDGCVSPANAQTATMTVVLAFDLLKRGVVKAEQLFIATFYREQQAVIRSIVAELPVFRGVEVMTVDGSQGRERDVVILDMVRLGRAAQESVGFLGQERRRFNVAMSRARVGLVVVGHSGFTDAADATWAQYLAHARCQGEIVGDNGSFAGLLPQGAARASRLAQGEFRQLAERLEKAREDSMRNYKRRVGGAKSWLQTVKREDEVDALTRRFSHLNLVREQTCTRRVHTIAVDQIDGAVVDVEEVALTELGR